MHEGETVEAFEARTGWAPETATPPPPFKAPTATRDDPTA
jgi:hypothetical protein